MLRVGDGLPDLDALEARQRDDVTGRRRLDLDSLQTLEAVKAHHSRLLGLSGRHLPGLAQGKERDGITDADSSPLDPSDRDAPDVR